MRCPMCNDVNSRVVDSRPTDDYISVRRRRECCFCQHRYTTYERLEDEGIGVLIDIRDRLQKIEEMLKSDKNNIEIINMFEADSDDSDYNCLLDGMHKEGHEVCEVCPRAKECIEIQRNLEGLKKRLRGEKKNAID